MSHLSKGLAVRGSDGKKLGKIDDLGGGDIYPHERWHHRYMMVPVGFLFSVTYFIGTEFIHEVVDGEVRLNVSAEEAKSNALNMRRDTPTLS